MELMEPVAVEADPLEPMERWDCPENGVGLLLRSRIQGWIRIRAVLAGQEPVGPVLSVCPNILADCSLAAVKVDWHTRSLLWQMDCSGRILQVDMMEYKLLIHAWSWSTFLNLSQSLLFHLEEEELFTAP